MIALWWVVLRKIIRISKANRITSLADFIASRYGKSALLGGLVTVIAVIGILPYISLQLKAVSTSFTILLQYPEIVMPAQPGAPPSCGDTAFWVALLLAAFTILFGTRHLDATERHEGMVAAIAFESLVKLLAFLAVGVFVTFGMYDGFGDIFARAAADAAAAPLLTPLGGVGGDYASWVWLTFLSMLAIMFLPRQFQVAVIENVDERHLTQGDLAVPALHAGDQHLRAADRVRRPAALPDRQRRRRHVRADAADGAAAGAARAARLHRRAVGGHRHGDRRDDRALDHGLQRPGDAGAAAHARAAPQPSARDLTGLLLGIRRGAIVLILLLGYLYFSSPAKPTRWSRSA